LAGVECNLSQQMVLGLERLVSARSRLLENQPQTRAENWRRWLDKVVLPGRVVGIGRSGKRLVLVTPRRDGSFTGVREDGHTVTLALERVGRVYAPSYPVRGVLIEQAFKEIRGNGKELLLPEPRLRDTLSEDDAALNLLNEKIDSVLPEDLNETDK